MRNLENLIEVAQKFASYGDAISGQIAALIENEVDCGEDIADMEERGELNPNVLRYAKQFLTLVEKRSRPGDNCADGASEILAAISEYESERNEITEMSGPAVGEIE